MNYTQNMQLDSSKLVKNVKYFLTIIIEHTVLRIILFLSGYLLFPVQFLIATTVSWLNTLALHSK